MCDQNDYDDSLCHDCHGEKVIRDNGRTYRCPACTGSAEPTKTTMKLCKDCKYYNTENLCCGNPWPNPISGESQWIHADAARLSEVYCGANAVKFEAKESSKPELLPCPFCGGVARVCDEVYWSILCADCHNQTKWNADKRIAIAAWNRRVK